MARTLGLASSSTAITGARFANGTLVTATRFGPITVSELLMDGLRLRSTFALPTDRGLGAWGLAVEGRTAWVGAYAPGHVTSVDLDSGKIHSLTPSSSPLDYFICALLAQESLLWAGTYPHGAAIGVHRKSALRQSTGRLRPGSDYIRQLAATADGSLLAAGASPAFIYQLGADGRVLRDLTPPGVFAEAAALTVAYASQTAFVGTEPHGLIGLTDLVTGHQQVLSTGERAVDALAVDGQVAFISTRPRGLIFRLDLSTGELSEFSTPVVGAETRALTVADGLLLGVTGSGTVWGLDSRAGTLRKLRGLADAGHPRLAEPVQSLLWAGGKLHVGGHFQITIHNRDNPQSSTFPVPGEPKRMVECDGWVVMALYPSSEIWRYRPQNPEQTLERIGSIPDGQTRPLTVVAGKNGDVFIGSQPDLGQHGGALTLVKGTAIHSFRNIVPTQSVRSIALEDAGRCFLGSDIHGGLGSRPLASEMIIAEVNVERGSLKWSTVPVPGAATCRSLVCHRGKLIGNTEDGSTFAINMDNGRVLAHGQCDPRGQLATHEGILGSCLLIVDPRRIIEIDPLTLEHRRTIFESEVDAQWYTEPQVATDSSGHLWTLRGHDLVRVT